MKTKQRGGTLIGLILGIIIGLGAALAVAVYVTKVPVPFLTKTPKDTEAKEAERNKGWDPNSPLYGKNPANQTQPVTQQPVAPTAPPVATPTTPPTSGPATGVSTPPATPEEDPGVQSVRRIWHFYKRHGFPTVVMGASFRNIGQVLALAGCDRLTIAPELLDRLAREDGELPRALEHDGQRAEPPAPLDEAHFRWQLNEDAMATDKLADGIRRFAADQRKLEAMLAARMAA